MSDLMLFCRSANKSPRVLFLTPGNFHGLLRVPFIESGSLAPAGAGAQNREKEHTMGGELIGLVAVVLGMAVPLGAMYTYYRVRQLRSEERLAAIARIEPGGTFPPRRHPAGVWRAWLHRHFWTDCRYPGGSRHLDGRRVWPHSSRGGHRVLRRLVHDSS
jgi:hypothetical protein